MQTSTAITCLFGDIGGVLLTNGWDRRIRKRAAPYLRLALAEMEERHGLTIDTYEEGKITMNAVNELHFDARHWRLHRDYDHRGYWVGDASVEQQPDQNARQAYP